MKKKLSVLLAGVMAVMLFSACGKETNNETAADNAVEATSQEAGTTGEAAATENAAESAEFTTDFDNLETKTLGDVKAEDYVTLGEYNGITIEASRKEVTDADVDDYVNGLKTSNPPMVEVTGRAVEDGDTVNIDYVGKYADTLEAFDGGTASGADLVIGSNTYIDGFESGLIGTEIGQTVDLNLTFPADYQAENLAGKDVVFTVTVNSIKVAADEITDEWAASLGYADVTTLDELTKYALNDLTAQAEDEYNSTVENSAIQQIYDAASFEELPQELVNRYILQEKQMLDYQANLYSYFYGQSLSTADLLSYYMNSEGFAGTVDEYLTSLSKDMAQQYVMFQAIADEVGITVSDEDIDEYLKDAYNNAGSTSFDSYEDYKASLDLEVYREGLMADKVISFVVEHANVVAAE